MTRALATIFGLVIGLPTMLLTWSGGNGPALYRVRVHCATRYAVMPEDFALENPYVVGFLVGVGERPLTQVWRYEA